MNKKNSALSTGLIVFLFILLLFQSKFIWMSFGSKKENFMSSTNTTNMMTEVLMPQKIITNLGRGEHYVLLDTRKFWSENIKNISEALKQVRVENLKIISVDDYLNLLNKKSVVFKFNSPLSGSIFVNSIGDEGGTSDINLSVDSIYIDSNNNIYVAGGHNFYKIEDIKTDIDIKNILDAGKKDGFLAENFNEAYEIKKDIFIPKNDTMNFQKVNYKSGLTDLLDSEKINLAERFLNVPIDYIREITEYDKDTFVYENEYLSLSENVIEYSNNSNFSVEDRNLYKSLNTAIEFISTKTGISGGIYLEKIEPIDLSTNKGYSFYFNLKDGAVPLVLSSEDNSFIEIDVFSDNVKSYREYYIRKVDDPSYEQEEIYLKSIDRVVYKNFRLFEGENLKDKISKINSVNIVYLNDKNNIGKRPMLAYEIIVGDRKYYFNITNGKLEMSVNGLE
ncbi:hypothetical protein [Peptoniphilus sp.]|jgi:hypothetical protein|uniref:hypothetical protein n=1 Tax=Peptoniphilus sp. TaxID=1971214 RepID=UPI003D8C6528